MIDPAKTYDFIATQLADPETQWGLGTFGAIAEFMRDPDEPVTLDRTADALSAVTRRGGIRLHPLPELRPIASETAVTDSWSHRVALCLPVDRCAMGRRTELTELGPDEEALRPQDRTGTLFDLGLGALQTDACIRVSDPELLRQLRDCVGRSVMERGNPAMPAILRASPHRVFVSRVGRAEVFQAIPSADGKSPEGPHTHVLPKLLQHGRTHAATEPVPEGWIPCAHAFPAHPVKDALGMRRPFDARRHDAFQRLLQVFGIPENVALKQQITEAVVAGMDPAVLPDPNDRHARSSIRVTLRQLEASAGALQALPAWIAVHEAAAWIPADDDDAAGPGGHP